MHKLQSLVSKHRNLVLYGIIGLSGATLDVIFYVVLYRFLQVSPEIASFLSVSIGIANNFFLNSRFNFKIKDRMLFRFANFYMIGLGGAILSSILIALLTNGLSVDPLHAKLITIVPVVLMQFALNKKLSFNDLESSPLDNHPLRQVLQGHWTILAVLALFLAGTLLLAHSTPLTRPYGNPDEDVHFRYNVQFILDNGRLPVSGQDDLSAFKTCTNDPFNHVPCRYSYQIYPQANYLVSAAGAWFFKNTIGVSYLVGARLVAVLFGVVALLFMYRTFWLITQNNRIAALIAGTVLLVPQVMFVFSYVNQDAHSIAIAAFAVYALTRLAQSQNRRNYLLAGLAVGGMLPLTKYNYFLLFIALGFVAGVAFWRRPVMRRPLLQFSGYTVLSFLLISSFWYVRNYLLYRDVFGQTFVVNKMAEFHPLGMIHPLFSTDTIRAFMDHDFVNLLFQSSFLVFGYFKVFAPDVIYQIVLIGLLASLGIAIALAFNQPARTRKRALFLITNLFLYLLAAVALVYFNSAKLDFQPQGRYLFSSLPLIGLVLAGLYSLSKQYSLTIYTSAALTAGLYVTAIIVILDNF